MALVGISVEEGIVGAEVLPESDEVTSSFIRAAAGDSVYTLRAENNFVASSPIVLDIDTGDSPCALHLALDIGRHCELHRAWSRGDDARCLRYRYEQYPHRRQGY